MEWVVSNKNETSLTHYGIKGMKWGVRKDRYGKGEKRKIRKAVREVDTRLSRIFKVVDMNLKYYLNIGRFIFKDPKYKDFFKQKVDQTNANYKKIMDELMEEGKFFGTGRKLRFENYY